MVEEAISLAITALHNGNRALADQVINGDQAIDRREVQIEEECLKILALYQPVASDLRFVVSVLKMNNDLERMGDYAMNIAERVVALTAYEQITIPPKMMEMADRGRSMVKKSLDALVESDAQLARFVCVSDDEVDELHRELYNDIKQNIRENIGQLDQWTQLLSVLRYLERIADLATNISQDVIYLVEGEVVRHKHEDNARKR